MVTREELEKLKEGGEILVRGKLVKFLYLLPEKYTKDNTGCVFTQAVNESDNWNYYKIEEVEIPKPEPKELGEVAWFKCIKTYYYNGANEGEGELYEKGNYRLTETNKINKHNPYWQRVEIKDGKAYEWTE